LHGVRRRRDRRCVRDRRAVARVAAGPDPGGGDGHWRGSLPARRFAQGRAGDVRGSRCVPGIPEAIGHPPASVELARWERTGYQRASVTPAGGRRPVGRGILIEVQGVTHAYGDRVVLRSVTTTLAEHRIGVIRANGSGKSTFARLLNGLVMPDVGTVTVHGVTTRKDAAAVRRMVGFVFTDPDAQIVMPTVAEDVAFGLRRRRLGKDKSQRLVAEALERVGLSGHADHPAHLLSGGQKQLLAITSVLVTEPRVLVCDEPTTLLDLVNTR